MKISINTVNISVPQNPACANQVHENGTPSAAKIERTDEHHRAVNSVLLNRDEGTIWETLAQLDGHLGYSASQWRDYHARHQEDFIETINQCDCLSNRAADPAVSQPTATISGRNSASTSGRRSVARNPSLSSTQRTFRESPQAGPSTTTRRAPGKYCHHHPGVGPSRCPGAQPYEYGRTLTDEEREVMLAWAVIYGSHARSWEMFVQHYDSPRSSMAWHAAYKRMMKKKQLDELTRQATCKH